jgi:hypothetical protein
MTDATHVSLSLALLLAIGGCGTEHDAPTAVTQDLACEPEQLRSVWWSEAGPFFGGGSGEVTLDPSGTHVFIDDMFRSTAVRLSDGTRSAPGTSTLELTDAAGVRVALPRMTTDAQGHNDYAGITDVSAIGTASPLASIPWIVPPDANGYTEVAAHADQTGDRVFLVERAIAYGHADRGLWLRSMSVSTPSDEHRVDLLATLDPSTMVLGPPYTIVVDEPRGIAFVTNTQQASSPRITRIDPVTGQLVTTTLTVGAPAALVGQATIGAPGTQLLDVALSADGRSLLASTRDGVVHTLDASTLEEIGAPLAVGVVVANADSYLPSVRSPVAATVHGVFVATLAADGRVRIVDTRGGAVRTTLTSTSMPRALDGSPAIPRVMQLRFLDDGLLVVSDGGVERYRCGN